MTHRDELSELSARSAYRGDVGHPMARTEPSESSESPPFRSCLAGDEAAKLARFHYNYGELADFWMIRKERWMNGDS
jgi:hypothetical protein